MAADGLALNILTPDFIFAIILLVSGLMGIVKGGIKSIGGLISLGLSGIIAYFLSKPITAVLFEHFNVADRVSQYISSSMQGIQYGTDTFNSSLEALAPFIEAGKVDFSAPIDVIQSNITGLMSNSLLQMSTIFVMLIIFSICMVIFGIIVYSFNSAFEKLPLGGMINGAVGFACGIIKGFIIIMMLYAILICLNNSGLAEIPLNDGFFVHTLENIRRLVNIP